MFKTILAGLIIGAIFVACGDINHDPGKNVSSAPSELDQCMNKYRWDTTAVNTSRMAVQMHYHRKGQGELAKHVSDRDAVRMVYCSGK